MAVLFFAVAAMASWVPARRAAGLEPTSALREEQSRR
jgi:ABC-type lipoprotein release transport system permease subunit